jgi:N6-L-threonylcarbamoyladenine synthase
VLSSVVSSQADLHARFGGVVPEIASRRHLELVAPVVREALAAAGQPLYDVERVAVTQGPGLVGALLVGLSAAKAIAWARGLPLVPVDHLEGHLAALYVEPDPVEPPFTCLLASGGHTLLLAVRERGGRSGSARRSTTPRARPSTREPGSWVSAIRAARRSIGSRDR